MIITHLGIMGIMCEDKKNKQWGHSEVSENLEDLKVQMVQQVGSDRPCN